MLYQGAVNKLITFLSAANDSKLNMNKITIKRKKEF